MSKTIGEAVSSPKKEEAVTTGAPVKDRKETDSNLELNIPEELTALKDIPVKLHNVDVESLHISKDADGKFDGGIQVEGDSEFGANVDIDGKLTLNSKDDIVLKDGSELGGKVELPITNAELDENGDFILNKNAYIISAPDNNSLNIGFAKGDSDDASKAIESVISLGEGVIQLINANLSEGSGSSVTFGSEFGGVSGFVDFSRDGHVFVFDYDFDNNDMLFWADFVPYYINFPEASLRKPFYGTLLPIVPASSAVGDYVLKASKTSDGTTYAWKTEVVYYQHTLTLSGTDAKLTLTAISKSNDVIDSLQDLANLFGGKSVSASGLAKINSVVCQVTKLAVNETPSNSVVTALSLTDLSQSTSTLGALGVTTIADEVTTINDDEQA